MNSLKQFFLLVLFIFSLKLGFSQLTYGIIGGLCSSQMTGDNTTGYNKAGALVGAFVNTCFEQKMEVEFNLTFIQKGSQKNPNPNQNDFTSYRVNTNYLELPILLRYNNSKFEYEGGIGLGYLLSDSEQNQNGSVLGVPFNKTDFSGLLGANYILSENVKLSIRYSRSIIPVREHASGASIIFNGGQYHDCVNFFIKYTI